jgi:flagellar motility protein MotE (MotC chaperone)
MAAKRARAGARGKGALLILSLMLVTSGLLRLGTEAGQAIALEAARPDPTEVAPVACTPPPDIATVLAALQDREAEADARAARIESRMQALRMAEREIAAQMAALTAAEEKLAATLALAETAAEDDLSKLTSVYENMKPKDAAALFESMSPEFAAGFLARMRAEAAAGIMAGLSPDSAYSVSVILAGRNARAPTE